MASTSPSWTTCIDVGTTTITATRASTSHRRCPHPLSEPDLRGSGAATPASMTTRTTQRPPPEVHQLKPAPRRPEHTTATSPEHRPDQAAPPGWPCRSGDHHAGTTTAPFAPPPQCTQPTHPPACCPRHRTPLLHLRPQLPLNCREDAAHLDPDRPRHCDAQPRQRHQQNAPWRRPTTSSTHRHHRRRTAPQPAARNAGATDRERSDLVPQPPHRPTPPRTTQPAGSAAPLAICRTPHAAGEALRGCPTTAAGSPRRERNAPRARETSPAAAGSARASPGGEGRRRRGESGEEGLEVGGPPPPPVSPRGGDDAGARIKPQVETQAYTGD